jgi:transcriptional regulator with XRE-family HTH domain
MVGFTRTYSHQTRSAAELLGREIRLSRLKRKMTIAELAERTSTTSPTIRKIEKGDLGVGIGLMFEAAAVLGVPLFSADLEIVSRERRRVDAELALLPSRADRPLSNDF